MGSPLNITSCCCHHHGPCEKTNLLQMTLVTQLGTANLELILDQLTWRWHLYFCYPLTLCSLPLNLQNGSLLCQWWLWHLQQQRWWISVSYETSFWIFFVLGCQISHMFNINLPQLHNKLLTKVYHKASFINLAHKASFINLAHYLHKFLHYF